jgi:hypothetical protein
MSDIGIYRGLANSLYIYRDGKGNDSDGEKGKDCDSCDIMRL